MRGTKQFWLALLGILALPWLVTADFATDWSGLHSMVAAFVAGAVIGTSWPDRLYRTVADGCGVHHADDASGYPSLNRADR